MYLWQLLLIVPVCGLMVTGARLANDDDIAQLLARASGRIDASLAKVRRSGNLGEVVLDLETSRSELEAAHRQLLALGREKESSFAVLRAGDCLRIVGRMNEAIERYQQAIAEARRANSRENEAKAWLGMERAQRIGLRNHQAAAEAIQKATQLVEKERDLWPIWMDVLGERAELELAEGNPETALATVQTAVSEAEQRDDKERMWVNLYTRSSIYNSLADLLRQEYLNLPFDTERAWKRCEETADRVRLMLRQAQSDTESAASIAGQLGHEAFAQRIGSEAGQLRELAQVFGSLAENKKAAHDFVLQSSARERKPVEPLMSTKDGKPIPVELLGPAISASNDLDRQKIVAGMRRAFAQEQRPESMTWRRRFLEGELDETENRVRDALALYRQAAAMVQEERKTVADEVLRGSFVSEKIELYDRLILNLLKLGEYGEALHWMEQSRARAMMDMLTTINVRSATSAEKLSYADGVGVREGNEPKAIAKGTGKQAPKLFELGESAPVDLVDLQKALKDTPCDLIYYVLHQGRIVLWHVGPTRTSAHAYYAPVSQLQSLGRSLTDSLSQRARVFDQEAAERLYFYLAQPALEVMETKHLVIVSPPELEGLPFQALFDKKNQEFLGEQIALSYSPSGSLVAELKPARALGPANLLLMIGPNLAGEGREAESIAAQYPHHDIMRGDQASFEELSKEAKGRTAIHVAAHGVYNEESPMLSYIELAKGSTDNGHATAAQMLALPLQGVSIFTLGSCSTARTRVDASSERYGFVRSLLYAGVQSVVLPLWDVSDEAASFWFQSFYANAVDHDLPEAARLANVAARRHELFGSHPRYWAGYRFVGH